MLHSWETLPIPTERMASLHMWKVTVRCTASIKEKVLTVHIHGEAAPPMDGEG